MNRTLPIGRVLRHGRFTIRVVEVEGAHVHYELTEDLGHGKQSVPTQRRVSMKQFAADSEGYA